jgi:hypothetical protein
MARATGLTGAAGEYYIAAELSRRDWLATVTIKNSPGTDVLAQRRGGARLVAIQAKTSWGTSWQLGTKDERPSSRNTEWYVLVSLRGEFERPSFYVVPRNVMAALVYLEHQDWLLDKGHIHGRARGVRNENERRTIRARWIEGYHEQWDLLDGSANSAPFLADHAFLEAEDDIGLPADFRPLRQGRRRSTRSAPKLRDALR